jgi:hypothetical protein
MREKTLKKVHNFYIPDFIAELLDQEAEKYAGKGSVTSAAILAFSRLSEHKKRESIKEDKKLEIEVEFNE